MIITNLEIKNILSIKKASLSFGTNGLILVEGYNHDDNRGNGSGKSAIFNAMSFALYDKLPRKITKSDILHKGTKSGFASCDVLVNGHKYTVKRYRPTNVEFFKDEKKIDIRQEEFESTIGLTYTQFLITMYTAQGEYNNRFMMLNDSKKKEFILDLMNFSAFDAYHKYSNESVKVLKQKEHMLESEINVIEHKIDTLMSSTKDAASIEKDININNDKVSRLQESLSELSSIKKPVIDKYDAIKIKIAEEISKIDTARNNRTKLLSEISSLENSKKTVGHIPSTHCPSCKDELFTLNGKLVKLTDIEELNSQCDAYNSKVDESISHKREMISKLDSDISNADKIMALSRKIDEQLKNDTREYDEACISINSINNEISYISKFNNVLIEQLKNSDKVTNDIISMRYKIDDLSSKLSNIRDDISVVSTVSNMFSSTGAPAHIMDDFVSNFNDMVQDNISLIWGNASYRLNTYKVGSNNKVTAKFSESLILNSKETSIGSLSGGESRSLSLAIDFTILNILEKYFSMSLNPIILDEPFDGLDSIGREIVIEFLQNISENKQILVIDHASEAKTMFSKIIKIEKKKGVSAVTCDII